MNRIQKIVSCLIGGVFLLSGLGKALNIFGFQMLIHGYGFPYLDLTAPVIVLAELVLGWLLIMQYHIRLLSLISGILLLVFTGIYTYGLTQQGITDCGCFGVAQLPELPPYAVYIRNIVLLALVNYLYFTTPDTDIQWTRAKLITTAVFFGASIFLTGMTFRPTAFLPQSEHALQGQSIRQTPFSRFVPKERSVMLLCYSYGCSHCQNTIENFLAMQRYQRVDTVIAVALTKDAIDTDSLRTRLREHYPQIVGNELESTLLPDITELPTSLLIEDDTIRQVIVGELPSPYSIETKKTKSNNNENNQIRPCGNFICRSDAVVLHATVLPDCANQTTR